MSGCFQRIIQTTTTSRVAFLYLSPSRQPNHSLTLTTPDWETTKHNVGVSVSKSAYVSRSALWIIMCGRRSWQGTENDEQDNREGELDINICYYWLFRSCIAAGDVVVFSAIRSRTENSTTVRIFPFLGYSPFNLGRSPTLSFISRFHYIQG